MQTSLYPSIKEFLPTSVKEMKILGWEQADIIIFSGDAYVDHPAFASAVIGRSLQSAGYKVAIVPQPNWQDDLRDFKKLGTPRLFFGVSAGNMDSMVNHYTANKRLRSDDAYTPGNKSGKRPDYPSIVYTKILKKLYPKTPVILGGIEASMRRFTHYDYWQNKLRPSFLIESGADILVYGQGEYPVIEIANCINSGDDYKHIPQIVYNEKTNKLSQDDILLATHKECLNSKKAFAKNFAKIEINSNKDIGNKLIQKIGDSYIIANPHIIDFSTSKLDAIFDLPYTRLPHPRYRNKASIPAYEMIKDSVNIHRGCFGGCSFCTISAHQGKKIISRSEKSIIKEVKKVVSTPNFSGHITDLGGPSANMYKMQGIDLDICSKCLRPSCIFPSVCKNLDTSHKSLIDIYSKVQQIDGVKKLSIGSGVRYDLILHEKNKDKSKLQYLENLIRHHVSGRLKVAPEHTSSKVVNSMRKPPYKQFIELIKLFGDITRKHHLKHQLIPYFISSHPTCNIEDMAELAAITKQQGYRLHQVQDFTPTPMTLSTVMFYTGIDPYSGEKIHITHSVEKKRGQHKYFFWYLPDNYNAIKKELLKFKRSDLIQKIYSKK